MPVDLAWPAKRPLGIREVRASSDPVSTSAASERPCVGVAVWGAFYRTLACQGSTASTRTDAVPSRTMSSRTDAA